MIITADERSAGRRLDVLIAEYVGSRNAAERIILANGWTKSRRVTPGETYNIQLPEPEPSHIEPEGIPLNIAYEDSDVIVINKPRGMVVHPAPGHYSGTLVNALLYHCGASLSGIGGELRPGIVHRIDKDTSGLIIAAKNDGAHRSLSAQLAERTLSRTYETIIAGGFKENSGVIDLPIGRNPNDRKKMAVVRSGGRNAVTHWELIARYTGYSHLRCKLQTGRTHQIRVHLVASGHAVIGDYVYGSAKNAFGLDGQCLHARELTFVHPRTNETITLTTELPEYFTAVLERLSFRA
jgi:23S rRNA pseudouridine1911/1915/1917 synthase